MFVCVYAHIQCQLYASSDIGKNISTRHVHNIMVKQFAQYLLALCTGRLVWVSMYYWVNGWRLRLNMQFGILAMSFISGPIPSLSMNGLWTRLVLLLRIVFGHIHIAFTQTFCVWFVTYILQGDFLEPQCLLIFARKNKSTVLLWISGGNPCTH